MMALFCAANKFTIIIIIIINIKKKRIRRLRSIKDCVNLSIQRLKDDLKKSKERSIAAINNSISNINTDRKTTITRKQKWKEKQLYRYFKQQTGEIVHEKTWA